MENTNWQDAVAFIVGLALVVAVLVLKVTPPEGMSLSAANWNFILGGGAVAIVAGSALYTHQPWEEWALLLLGLWLVISPWALGFAGVSVYVAMAVVAGLIVAALAGATVFRTGGSTKI